MLKKESYRREWPEAAVRCQSLHGLTPMKNNINVTVVFLCAGVASALLVVGLSPTYDSSELLLVVSGAGFFMACVLVWLRPDIAYRLGVASGALGFYWFRQLEFGHLFPAMNSWIVLNLPDDNHFTQDVLVAKLKIVFFITVLVATGISTIRLLPPVEDSPELNEIPV